eukprot:SAG31_NODE_487_length_14980_cov_9.526376_6_plen_147_part_00
MSQNASEYLTLRPVPSLLLRFQPRRSAGRGTARSDGETLASWLCGCPCDPVLPQRAESSLPPLWLLCRPSGGWEQGLGPGCETCNGWKAAAPLDRLHYCSSEQRLSESVRCPGFAIYSGHQLPMISNTSGVRGFAIYSGHQLLYDI